MPYDVIKGKYQQLLQEDPAAASAFAKQHGIQEERPTIESQFRTGTINAAKQVLDQKPEQLASVPDEDPVEGRGALQDYLSLQARKGQMIPTQEQRMDAMKKALQMMYNGQKPQSTTEKESQKKLKKKGPEKYSAFEE